MFICRACWKRALNSTLVTHPTSSRLPSVPQATNAFRSLDSRHLATAAVGIRKVEPREDASSKAIRWKVKKHLEYLDNNYKIAEHVERTLERGDYDEALLLVREASRKGDVTVSWNHLIGYLMRNQRLHAAVKLYNEMKKRDQMPNAQTYTILFRGFAKSDHPRLAVSEAVRIYHTMMTSKRLQPNIIHMNAVLEVCGRAGDMDSLFSIVSTADDKLRSPDSRTYTTILHSLRPKIPTHRLPRRRPEEEEEDDETALDTERGPAAAAEMSVINQAKAIWEEVITRWRKAKIVIDERLVCAMGRLLRHGGREENDEILDLVEQTMNIPRQDMVTASLPSPERPQPTQEGDQPTTAVAKVKTQHGRGPKPGSVGYAVPGNNTLSLVLESLRATRKTSLGPKYWNLFVNEYNVEPDQENYHSYLRLLRVGHNSTKTADVIPQIPAAMLTPKTFRIGLSCCVKDNLNKHAFANATRVFKAMKGLRVPDALAMRLYMQATRANFRPVIAGLSKEEGKSVLGRQIAIAIDNMWEPFGTLTRSLSFSSIDTRSQEEMLQHASNEAMEAMATAKRMVAAMDFVVTEAAAEPKVIKLLKARRNILNGYVMMFNEKRHKLEGKLAKLDALREKEDVKGASESRPIPQGI